MLSGSAKRREASFCTLNAIRDPSRDSVGATSRPAGVVSRSAESQSSVVGSTLTRHRLRVSLAAASTYSMVPSEFHWNRNGNASGSAPSGTLFEVIT